MVQTSQSGINLLDTPISDDRADALIARHILQDRWHPGRHEAQVESSSSRPKVWAMVRYLQAADVEEVAKTYGLSPEAIEATVAYYQRHRDLIDAAILLDDEEWNAS
ncbi:MAG: hypothetical protein ACRDJH_02745 [Thermomicrobiales bacterium]